MSKSVAILAATASLIIGAAVFYLLASRRKRKSDEVNKKSNGFLPKESSIAKTCEVVKPVSDDFIKPYRSSDVTSAPHQTAETKPQIENETGKSETDHPVHKPEPESEIPDDKLEDIVCDVVAESDLNQSVAESFASLIGENPDRVLKKNFEFENEEEVLIVPQSIQKVESERPDVMIATEAPKVEEDCSILEKIVDNIISEPPTMEKVDSEPTNAENIVSEPKNVENCIQAEATKVEEAPLEPKNVEKVVLEEMNIEKVDSEPKIVEKAVLDLVNDEKIIFESGDFDKVPKPVELSAESSRNDSESFLTAESGNTEESSNDADDEKTSKSIDLSSFEDLGGQTSLKKVDSSIVVDTEKVISQMSSPQKSDVESCDEESSFKKSKIESTSEESSSPGLQVTESEQVFTFGFNDSMESDEKNSGVNMTWAPADDDDEDDFSDRSETMQDDQSMSSATETNGKYDHTFLTQTSHDGDNTWLGRNDDSAENENSDDEHPKQDGEHPKPKTGKAELVKNDSDSAVGHLESSTEF